MECLFEYQSQNSGKHWPMTVTVKQWNCTWRKWYTYIIRTFTWSKGLDPDNLPAVDHQIKWDTKHGAWSDDPRLETWHLYRSCYCYDDKFNIYPFIMRWKWKFFWKVQVWRINFKYHMVFLYTTCTSQVSERGDKDSKSTVQWLENHIT